MAKKQLNPLADLQSAVDALQERVPHFAWLGASQRENAHDLLRRAKVLLDPEPALELANAMNEISDVSLRDSASGLLTWPRNGNNSKIQLRP